MTATFSYSETKMKLYLSVIATAKLFELRNELLPYLPYSPNFSPCDFFLFSNFEKCLVEKRFMSNEKIIAETEAYFVDFHVTYFLDGFQKSEFRLC